MSSLGSPSTAEREAGWAPCRAAGPAKGLEATASAVLTFGSELGAGTRVEAAVAGAPAGSSSGMTHGAGSSSGGSGSTGSKFLSRGRTTFQWLVEARAAGPHLAAAADPAPVGPVLSAELPTASQLVSGGGGLPVEAETGSARAEGEAEAGLAAPGVGAGTAGMSVRVKGSLARRWGPFKAALVGQVLWRPKLAVGAGGSSPLARGGWGRVRPTLRAQFSWAPGGGSGAPVPPAPEGTELQPEGPLAGPLEVAALEQV